VGKDIQTWLNDAEWELVRTYIEKTGVTIYALMKDALFAYIGNRDVMAAKKEITSYDTEHDLLEKEREALELLRARQGQIYQTRGVRPIDVEDRAWLMGPRFALKKARADRIIEILKGESGGT